MTLNEIILWTIFIVGGFLSGSVMYCWLIPKFVLDRDICALSDDHNPGASNVFKSCGVFWGMFCLVLDLLKGYIPVRLACNYLDSSHILFAFVLAAPVLGHALAPFLSCGGGKCISTAFGSMLGLIFVDQIVILLAVLYILFSTVIKIPSHRIRSIITFGLFGIMSCLVLWHKQDYSLAIGCIFISTIAIWKHSKHFMSGKEEAFELLEGEEQGDFCGPCEKKNEI